MESFGFPFIGIVYPEADTRTLDPLCFDSCAKQESASRL
jgi:hypothetical protein